jgi:hypothetical protein
MPDDQDLALQVLPWLCVAWLILVLLDRWMLGHWFWEFWK